MTRGLLGALLVWASLTASPAIADPALTAKLDAYFASNSFSGAILVTQHDGIVYDKAFGLADAERNLPNRTSTSFHIGSLSRLYVAAAVMKRVDKQRLWLTNTVAQFDASVPGGDTITIGNLLQRDDTAAYDLLARILEINSGKRLADVLDDDFFGPYFMTGSGLDDGVNGGERRMAQGYAKNAAGTPTRVGPSPLGGVFTTTHNALRWIDALFADHLVSPAAREAMAGAGLIRPASTWLGPGATVMEGRGPGFSAAAVHQEAQGVTVIVLANREYPPGATSQLAVWLAAQAILGAGGDVPLTAGH